jgi:dihydroneopterin aldolase
VSDRVSLLNIVVYGNHGVSAEEQAVGRPFEVDVEMRLDLRRAGESDDLDATVDYAAVCEVVKQVNASGPFRLLEAFAERIAKQVLARYPVAEVTVRVRKPHPPVGLLVFAAQVEITRADSGTATELAGE